MNRPIKFRAWDKIRKTFAYGDMPYGFFKSFYDEKNFGEIQQFTGLLDKNGKEIYEGDVLQGDYEGWGRVRGQTVWVDCSYEVSMINPKDEHFWDLEDNEKWEVIGNIYEHPELLKP